MFKDKCARQVDGDMIIDAIDRLSVNNGGCVNLGLTILSTLFLWRIHIGEWVTFMYGWKNVCMSVKFNGCAILMRARAASVLY